MLERKRVAVYARVSTAQEAQLYALSNQKQYYEEILSARPEWILYEMYVDEGLSGTTTQKRVNFQRMMDDAKNGKFDLIVTREVSRFARNTVDTLVCTRELKKYGVEVWFIEDNIHTFNDDDGELKLTLLATLAQNESKKVSVRVRAGQYISFINGVAYGNGNIMGYERVGRDLVVNEKQAEVVRAIFDMYISGMGLQTICYELEKKGFTTATGKEKWNTRTISHILHNSFYCGRVVYRKSYTKDYLDHKRYTNQGDVETIVVEGKHQPIISVEKYEKAQKVLFSKTSHQRNFGKGVKLSEDVWVRKMRCCCGRTFARRMWHRKASDGSGQLTYRCRSQEETGCIQTRKNKGLSIDGICDTPWVQRWKLESMLWTLFRHMWEYRDKIIDLAMQAVAETINIQPDVDHGKQIAVCERQLEDLLDLYLERNISKQQYLERREKLELQKKKLQELEECDNICNVTDVETRLRHICNILEESFHESTKSIPDELIDVFVDKIIVYKDYFEWYINFSEDTMVRLQLHGTKRNHQVINKYSVNDYDVQGSRAGCYC